jgi:hypothetical protein
MEPNEMDVNLNPAVLCSRAWDLYETGQDVESLLEYVLMVLGVPLVEANKIRKSLTPKDCQIIAAAAKAKSFESLRSYSAYFAMITQGH